MSKNATPKKPPAPATHRAPKPTEAEYAQRVSEVFGLLVKRKSRGYILNHAAQKWQIETRQADELIARATAFIRESAAYDRDLELAMALETLRAVIGKATDMHDFQRIIAAQREINLLLALYAPPAKQTLAIEGLDLFALLATKADAVGIDVQALLTAMIKEVEGMKHEK